MKRNSCHTNTLKEWLSHSTEPEQEARKTYWRLYKANWRKNRRKEQKEFTVSFSPQELRLLTHNATSHHRSITRFIKEATLSYCTQQFLVPDQETVDQIRQILSLMYSHIQKITEDAVVSEETGATLMEKITLLETSILNCLTNSQQG